MFVTNLILGMAAIVFITLAIVAGVMARRSNSGQGTFGFAYVATLTLAILAGLTIAHMPVVGGRIQGWIAQMEAEMVGAASQKTEVDGPFPEKKVDPSDYVEWISDEVIKQTKEAPRGWTMAVKTDDGWFEFTDETMNLGKPHTEITIGFNVDDNVPGDRTGHEGVKYPKP